MKAPAILYIVSDIDKSLGLEWTARELQSAGCSITWILINKGDSHLERFLKDQSIDVYRITHKGKSSLLFTIWKIWRLLIKKKPDIVHAHLFDASLTGLMAAKLAGVKKRILTRHHATFHHEYFPRAVYYDQLISSLATHIVAVSENVRQVLIEKENVKSNKVTVCHHGFDLDYFGSVSESEVESLKHKYGLGGKGPVVGVISRYLELKGIQFIVPAFEKLLAKYPNTKLVLANAQGNYEAQVKKLLQRLPTDSFIEIPFETNLKSLYRCFDVFVHCPVNQSVEAFGQTYVEALLMKVPSVFTPSGVAVEFIRDGENALFVPFRDSDSIFKAIVKLMEAPEWSTSLAEKGYSDVSNRFKLKKMINCLQAVYAS